MINKDVRKKLLGNLRITAQALSQRAARIKSKHGPMTTDEAVYLIAHMVGIDLSKYLPLTMLDRIRSLIPKDVSPHETRLSIEKKKESPAVRDNKVIKYPLVDSSVVKEAYNIGKESYPRLFILENSIRKLIEDVLSNIKTDWWNELVPKDVRDSVQRIMNKEKRYAHRSPRGSKPILYSDFSHLSKIISDNMPHFKDIIVNENWFKTSMDEVYMSRNNVAHSILLRPEDISKINTFYSEWERVLKVAGRM